MPELRWRLADGNDPQGALFEEVERHVGRGEFRGMEFLHVQARRVINEVPKASRMPFRWTINAYRGCSHACSYCLEGSTLVLMADGRTKTLASLEVGDMVYGTRRVGAYRRFTPTPVLDHWSTVKPAYRVTLAGGTELIASGDHRFLSERGWKHVTGTEHGPARRPHLTPNNRLLGTGGFAAGPGHDDDYRRGYLCGMIRGDGNVGHFDYPRDGRSHGRVHRFRLALTDPDGLERTQRHLLDLGVRTTQFAFQAASERRQAMTAIRTQPEGSVAQIERFTEWPDRPSDQWAKGFLAGIFDGEGSYSRGILRIADMEPAIIRAIEDAMQRFHFATVVESTRRGIYYVRLLGGLAEHLRFFHTVDNAILRKRGIAGRAVKVDSRLTVQAVEPLGVELPLFDITTGTGDFVANGVISHNCFARPTHEYLGMNTGEDFERRIVVKINAVERVRAELAPARWAGEHIAMGTNTDPYQRCEGKYRLTQGIVGALSAVANPFSILTKSTLILRDLDLLAEAATRTDVRANFSIGTLDEEVWRLTEPGTPHPMRRVEAVARLNEAGIPSGVLLAPVLPGLSDDPEQIEAVVKACVEAGATFISPLLLHLRPGVREHYLSWLVDARPELAEQYAALYPKAYQPAKSQDRLADMVRGMVERHGGRAVRPAETRTDKPKRVAAPPPARPRQLGLGM